MSPAQPTSSSSLRRSNHLIPVALLTCAFLTCALAGVANAADLYRWTDAQGVAHFSDKPPKGVNAEKIKTKTRRPPPVEEDVAAEETQASNPDAERCKAEQERLSLLRNNSRVQMQDQDGKLRELTAKEIAEEMDFSQRAVARFCNP